MLTLRKKIAYSLVTTILFFTIASVLIFTIESLGWIDTERLNDRVAYAPINAIKIHNTENGKVASIVDPLMIRRDWSVEVPPNTLRILLAGGSFAESNPYSGSLQPEKSATPGSIQGWLEQLLHTRYPSLNVEVVNVAAGGANSSRVRELVRAGMVLHPSIVIVASGNNEGYNPGSINETMHRWVLYRIMKKELLADAPTKPQPYWMVRTREFSNYKDVFIRNLAAIEKIASENGAHFVASTMPINLDYDFSGSIETPAADRNLDEGQRLLDAGNYEAAIERLSDAPVSGVQARLIATAYERLGHYDLAREAYQLAMTFYTGCRTAPEVNALITEFAESHNLPLANLDEALRQSAENGVTTHVFFCDDCHMNWKGYYLVALEMARAIERAGLIPDGYTAAREFPPPDEILPKPGWILLTQGPVCAPH